MPIFTSSICELLRSSWAVNYLQKSENIFLTICLFCIAFLYDYLFFLLIVIIILSLPLAVLLTYHYHFSFLSLTCFFFCVHLVLFFITITSLFSSWSDFLPNSHRTEIQKPDKNFPTSFSASSHLSSFFLTSFLRLWAFVVLNSKSNFLTLSSFQLVHMIVAFHDIYQKAGSRQY